MKTAQALGSYSLRSFIGALAAVWAASLPVTGGCSPDGSAPEASAGTGSSAGAFASSGSGNLAGSPQFGGGANVTAGNGNSTAGGSNDNSTGGSGSSGNSAGGTVSSGGSGSKPCVDTAPPPDATWPDATCQKWASETSECSAAWFASYCDVSCKRCVPTGGGSAGSSSTGGSGHGAGGGGNPAGGSSAGGSTSNPAVDCSTKGMPNVTGGNGFATRYWDCCQPHCSQFDGHKCNQDGTSKTSNNQSSCSGGGSFACYDEAPKAVNDCLSYGYIAKSNPNCGQCYRIQFTGEGEHNAADPGSKAIKGKQMIVKVSNTGGDVANNQFDLMIPGGGVGQFNACSKQWGSSDLGAQYGGFLTNCTGSYDAKKSCVRQQCTKIPAGPARDGCLWFVDWLQAADNPKFTSQQTDCPF